MGAYRNFKMSLNIFLMEMVKQHVAESGTALPTTAKDGRFFYRTSNAQLYLYQAGKWTAVPLDKPLFDFDAAADENAQFPNHDYVGLWGVTIAQRAQFYDVSCMIGLGIYTDSILHRHDEVVDQLFDTLHVLSRIPVYDAQTGNLTEYTLQVVDDVAILPMSKSNERPLQFLSVNFVTDHTGQLA